MSDSSPSKPPLPKGRVSLIMHIYNKAGSDTSLVRDSETRFLKSSALVDRSNGYIRSLGVFFLRDGYQSQSQLSRSDGDIIEFIDQDNFNGRRGPFLNPDYERLHTHSGLGWAHHQGGIAAAVVELDNDMMLGTNTMQALLTMVAYGHNDIAVLPDPLLIKVADNNLKPVTLVAGHHSGLFHKGETIPVGVFVGGASDPGMLWNMVANRTFIIGTVGFVSEGKGGDMDRVLHWGTFALDRSTRTVFYFDSCTTHVQTRLEATVEAISALLRPIGLESRLTGLHLESHAQPDNHSCSPLSIWMLLQCVRVKRGIHCSTYNTYDFPTSISGARVSEETFCSIASEQVLRLPLWNEWQNAKESVGRIRCLLQHMALVELGHKSGQYNDKGRLRTVRSHGMFFELKGLGPHIEIDYHDWFKGFFNINPLGFSWEPIRARYELVETEFNEDMSLQQRIAPFRIEPFIFEEVPMPVIERQGWICRGWGNNEDPPWAMFTNMLPITLPSCATVCDGHGYPENTKKTTVATMDTLLSSRPSPDAPSRASTGPATPGRRGAAAGPSRPQGRSSRPSSTASNSPAVPGPSRRGSQTPNPLARVVSTTEGPQTPPQQAQSPSSVGGSVPSDRSSVSVRQAQQGLGQGSPMQIESPSPTSASLRALSATPSRRGSTGTPTVTAVTQSLERMLAPNRHSQRTDVTASEARRASQRSHPPGSSMDLMSSARDFLLRIGHISPGSRIRGAVQRHQGNTPLSTVVLSPAGLVDPQSWFAVTDYLSRAFAQQRAVARGPTREERYAERQRRREGR